MIWLMFAILFLVAFWGIGAMRTRGERARPRLNNQGLPQGATRDDHRRNDEE